jgi:endonuclease-3
MPVDNRTISKVIKLLKEEYKRFNEPIVSQIAYHGDTSPYKVLISTVISLRTKDDVTRAASLKLFSVADTPEKMVKLKPDRIEKLIYPAGFYKTKAINIIDISKILLEEYDGKVPDEIDELLKLKGVGRKTANLVVTLGYGKLGVCVDTHVHRISNRFGYVKTKTPEETEFALRKKLDKKYWIIYNDLLVSYGQNLCKPISPFCSKCRISEYCKRVGVTRSR